MAKWKINLKFIFDNLRCVKNPRFVPLQTLLKVTFTTFYNMRKGSVLKSTCTTLYSIRKDCVLWSICTTFFDNMRKESVL